ncbi:UDP-N-acetylmuramate--L-alanine ligase [Candidatus Daviesbacteria bacterium]|nr:UDP-N-acetylmuramate--L-alanine ligase [Candidatus Daviesbacteria bacterium]
MKIHFLGIGGSGISAAAALAKAKGFEVSGCDSNPFTEFTENFDRATLYTGHLGLHLGGVNLDLLIITPAILSLDPENEELIEAKKLSIPILTWHEFLAKYLMKDKFIIAVCGTHGKSTTTGMIAEILEDSGLDPSVVLGAIVPRWNANFRVGESKYFIIEADEFNDNFLNFHPEISIITSIEFDHPEYFKNFEDYKHSFRKFLSQTSQTIFANLSDAGVRETLVSDKASKDFHFPEIIDYSKSLEIDLPLKLVGNHNFQNALAAFQVGLAIGLDASAIKTSLMNFVGIGRRFEYLGDYKKAHIYSDFGHHPTEIKVTLKAAREKFPKNKIYVVFQPHMFSRTKVLFNDFVSVLKQALVDKIFILDIYPSREIDNGLVSAKDLVKAIDKPNIIYSSSASNLLSEIKSNLQKDDIIFFLGAGDTHNLAKQFLND